jgi:hypothetical protein
MLTSIHFLVDVKNAVLLLLLLLLLLLSRFNLGVRGRQFGLGELPINAR